MKKILMLSFILSLSVIFGFAFSNEAKAYENTAKPESTVPWEYPTNKLLQKQSVDAPLIADISKWQGNINWDQAADALDLVIIRTQDGISVEDYMHRSYESAAKRHDLPFGVYSFVRAGTPAEARAEARAFYNRASKNTEFYVLDVEVKTNKNGYSMRTVVNEYVKELRELTDKKIGLYVANHLYSSFNLDTSKFEFVWIPRYGYTPPAYNHQLWQYTSSGRVPGIKGNVDLNRLANGTKLEFFTNKISQTSNSELVKKYYVTNPQYVILKKKVKAYKKRDLVSKNYKKTYAEGSVLKVKKITKSSAGTPRLELSNGLFVTASKALVLKTTAAKADTFYTADDKVKKIITMKDLYIYDSSTSNRNPEKIPKYTIFNVNKVVYNGSGQNRFQILSGKFVSASKNDVIEAPNTIENYYRDVTDHLQTKKKMKMYETLMFGEENDENAANKPVDVAIGTNIQVVGIEYNKLGYPRFRLDNGKYVSAKKTLYKEIPWYEQ